MNFNELFSQSQREAPFENYAQYTGHLFACVDRQLSAYIDGLKDIFANEGGGYKNVLYPDIEIAHSLTEKHLADFVLGGAQGEGAPGPEEADDDIDPELAEILGSFAMGEESRELSVDELLDIVQHRAALTNPEQVPMPMYRLSQKLGMGNFTLFCFACAVLSSTQTNYAAIFQVVNQNSSYSCPTIESAARVYYGNNFSMNGAYSEMSGALEQLMPVIEMKVNPAIPFSTVVSPDKRMIDFLFGSQPLRPDQNYSRFFKVLGEEGELDPFIANKGQLDALTISYEDNVRLFNLYGDEGAGKRFTTLHFCEQQGLSCITLDGAKLFVYDFSFVNTALWAVCRECILSDAVCALINLKYREEEKEKFFGYMDLAFGKLRERGITAFTLSPEKLPLREMTDMEFTQIELPTPNVGEREEIWRYYSEGYTFAEDVDLTEMAAKFLFTPGKVKAAIKLSRGLSAMERSDVILRGKLFEACYNQMSHELTQKATKIKATYTWDDIVMSADQREALENACNQMKFRKQVYENWDYNRKYPYGRGLSVLLFGAPGTGKSMCAQVLANALNLELYRVDLSKVVDKYVGETEKSISMIFREAKKCNVVLFFDECDTLFAKRSDDGGSGQASNNNKTALLLQEVEAYDGVSVLATNYKHNIDPAFFRRMKYIVEFQFPDPDTREILWRTTIPKGTPLAEDVDVRFLAERFEFVGGNIKNCILNAAFLAAAEGQGDKVHMRHYLQAIRYEFVKTGKVFTRSDFEPYADMVM